MIGMMDIFSALVETLRKNVFFFNIQERKLDIFLMGLSGWVSFTRWPIR